MFVYAQIGTSNIVIGVSYLPEKLTLTTHPQEILDTMIPIDEGEANIGDTRNPDGTFTPGEPIELPPPPPDPIEELKSELTEMKNKMSEMEKTMFAVATAAKAQAETFEMLIPMQIKFSAMTLGYPDPFSPENKELLNQIVGIDLFNLNGEMLTSIDQEINERTR